MARPIHPFRGAASVLAALAACHLPAQGLHPLEAGDAGGRIDGDVRLTRCTVLARLDEQTASTQLRQTFRNDGTHAREAIWLLPLPEGAAVDGFQLTADGKPMASEVLDAQGARQLYESIVRQQRDPGLLEYAGRGCLRARVFPIPPRSELEVEVRWRQVLPVTGGLREWSFPLRATRVARRAPEQMVLDVQIATATPIRTVFSSLPGVEIRMDGLQRARVGMEVGQGLLPERDLDVFFGLEQRAFGLHLITHRPGAGDGWFLMAIAPGDEARAQPTPRALQFALDTSGSMSGNKLQQAVAAARYFLQSLRPDDWFDLVPFATEPQPLFGRLVRASPDRVQEALHRLAGLEARGGTNLGGALQQVLRVAPPDGDGDGSPPLAMAVLLTDGMPTVGITDEGELVRTLQDDNRLRQRVFVLGVGNDLNARLLDRVAAVTRGSRDYVREGEDLELKTGALFDRLRHPAMTALAISCPDAGLEAVHPRALPDLFCGDQLLVLGRYRKPGRHQVRLRGEVAGRQMEFAYQGEFAAAARHDFVPPLWAERRIAELLDAMRQNGRQPELVDEVTRLGREFAVVTPFTSHLVLEDADRRRLGGGPQYRGPGDVRPPAPGGGRGSGQGPTGPTSLGPAGPATPGPAGGRAPAPAGPTTGGVATGSDDFFLGTARRVEADAARARLVLELQRIGALPANAKPADVDALLQRIGDELRAAERRLGRLDRDATGKDAVASSAWLAQQVDATRRSGDGETQLLALFTRRLGDRTLRLRGGVWTEPAYDAKTMADRVVTVTAFSDDYFALLRRHEALGPVFAFSTSLLLVIDGVPHAIRPE